MRRLLRKLVPNRIAGQIALLVIGSLVLAYIVTAITVILFAPRPTDPPVPSKLAQLGYTAKLLSALPAGEARAQLVEAARQSFPNLHYSANPSDTAPEIAGGPPWMLRALQESAGDQFRSSVGPPHVDPDGRERVTAEVRLPDGSSLRAAVPNSPEPPHLKRVAIFVTLVFLAITLALLSLWVAKRLAAPLTRFADAADQFTVDGLHSELREEGPLEIKRAARALNEMRGRIKTLVDGRTRMLAAVGHDLRTPITRLLLRAEDIEDHSLRRQFMGDLHTMGGMVESALSFLREQTTRNQPVRTDLSSLLQSVCDDFVDMGGNVDFAGPRHCLVDCDPDQMGRAVTNLVENAVKFGRSATIRLKTATADNVEIEVEDDGPGIPDAEKDRVFEPFYRADSGRSPGRGGFGLGLSIARAIAEAHGGRLSLEDAVPSGLIARLTLPTSKRAPSLQPQVRVPAATPA
jgi:signal transduction histidine kinase